MAVNRYMQPAEAQFINTYVPIPFEDIMRIGLLKQARIDEDLANQEKMLTEYSSFATAPGADETEREEILNEIRKDFGSMQGLPGTYDHRQEALNIRSKWASDPRVKDLVRNAKVYEEMQSSRKKAKEEDITSANTLELDTTVSDYFKYGRKGLKEKTGSGQLYPSSYYKNVNIREGLKEWSKDVHPSVGERQFLDPETGRYLVTSKNAGISMSAVSRPYGIDYKVEYVKGKPTLVPDLRAFQSDGFVKIMDSNLGAQIRRDAKEDLIRRGEEPTNENIMQESYRKSLSTINSIVQERIYTDSSIRLEADPYELADYRHRLEDQAPDFTYPMYSDTKAGSLTSSVKVDQAKNEIQSSLDGLLKRKEQLAAEHGGIRERVETFKDSEGRTFTRTFYEGADGTDQTDAMNIFNSEASAQERQMGDIENLERKLKKQAGIKEDYTPSEQVLQEAHASGMAAVANHEHLVSPEKLPKSFEEYNEKDREIYNKARARVLKNKDPKYAKYEDLLKENSKSGLIQVGVTRFGSEKLNTVVEENGLRYFAENKPGTLGGGFGAMDWVQETDKGTFNNKDYENINNGLPPMFMGYAFDSGNDGRLKFVYRFQTKKSTKEAPVYTDAIKTEAPSGAAEYLVKAGKFTDAERYLSQVLSEEELGVDKMNEAVNIPGISEKYSMNFEVLTPGEVSLYGSNYRLAYPEKNQDGSVSKTVKYFNSKQDVITQMISYYRAIDEIKNK